MPVALRNKFRLAAAGKSAERAPSTCENVGKRTQELRAWPWNSSRERPDQFAKNEVAHSKLIKPAEMRAIDGVFRLTDTNCSRSRRLVIDAYKLFASSLGIRPGRESYVR